MEKRRAIDTLAAIMLTLSSAAVTIGVSVYLMRLPPVALQSDITAVKQTAVEALKQTHVEQKTQDKASALVATAVGTHGEKIKSANDRINQLEKEVATLKKRVGLLDGSILVTVPPPVKHAHHN